MNHLFLTILLTVNPYISRVFEYMPAPGQFINTLPAATEEDTPQTMAQKAEDAIANNAGGMICLGAFGGYVVFGFDHPVANSGTDYDFKISGNATYANNAKDNTRKGGASEPGIVMVSYDANSNGLPDDTWYELAGSEYYKPETQHNYTVTYRRPEGLADVPWTDSNDSSSVVPRNSFHKQDYYPLWAPDELTFTGTLLAPNAVNEGTGGQSYFVLYCYDFGYADNHPNNTEGCKFRISWAVDKDGKSVNLPAIHFVKVYTGIQQVCGWLGETSTEIAGAEDLHPDMEPTTDIIETQLSQIARKVLRGGQMMIIRDNKAYNPLGISISSY